MTFDLHTKADAALSPDDIWEYDDENTAVTAEETTVEVTEEQTEASPQTDAAQASNADENVYQETTEAVGTAAPVNGGHGNNSITDSITTTLLIVIPAVVVAAAVLIGILVWNKVKGKKN